MYLFIAIFLYVLGCFIESNVKRQRKKQIDANFRRYEANKRRGQNYLLLRLYILEEMEKLWDEMPEQDARIEAIDRARQRVIAEGFLPDNVHPLGPIYEGYRSRPDQNHDLTLADSIVNLYHENRPNYDYSILFADMKNGAVDYLIYYYAADFGVTGNAGFIPYSYKSPLLPEEVKEDPYYNREKGRQFGIAPEKVERIRKYQEMNCRKPCGNPLFCYDE